MALNAYLTCTAETQGEIKGSCDIDPHIDAMEVWAFSHEVISPTDAASGAKTGKRQHKPFTVSKPVDKASPLLMNALVSNERINEWKLRIYRPSPTGAEEEYFNIELKDASIAAIRQSSLDNKDPANMARPFYEIISFSYQTIIWTWMDGGITAQDEWKVQRT